MRAIFYTSREELEVAGAHKKLDYLGAFSWLQTANDLPNDEYHVATSAANLGWALSGTTQIRATLHYGVDATGVPNAWDFYHVADDATEKDQDLFLSASIDNQTTASLHNNVRYGLTRKREQVSLWSQSGNSVPVSDYPTDYCFGPETLGNTVTITGANGYSATGQAVLDCSTFRAQYRLQSRPYRLSGRHHHHAAPHRPRRLSVRRRARRGAGQHLLHARRAHQLRLSRSRCTATSKIDSSTRSAAASSTTRCSGFRLRRAPVSLLSFFARAAVSSAARAFSSTSAKRCASQAHRSGRFALQLPRNLTTHPTIQSLHISPLAAPAMRTYEGGVEQSFFSQHIIFKSSYFHNEFGKEIEYVGLDLVPALLPNLTPAQQQQLEANPAGQLRLRADHQLRGLPRSGHRDLRRRRHRLQPVSPRRLHLPRRRGAALLHQRRSDAARPHSHLSTASRSAPIRRSRALAPSAARRTPATSRPPTPTNESPESSPRPLPAAATTQPILKAKTPPAPMRMACSCPTAISISATPSSILAAATSCCDWIDIYAQAENLLDNQHIAPIGYPSLPFTVRTGLRIRWGPGSGH